MAQNTLEKFTSGIAEKFARRGSGAKGLYTIILLFYSIGLLMVAEEGINGGLGRQVILYYLFSGVFLFAPLWLSHEKEKIESKLRAFCKYWTEKSLFWYGVAIIIWIFVHINLHDDRPDLVWGVMVMFGLFITAFAHFWIALWVGFLLLFARTPLVYLYPENVRTWFNKRLSSSDIFMFLVASASNIAMWFLLLCLGLSA